MDSILLERGCSAEGDGEGPNLGSVDALSSVFARMRRSHAEHSQACDSTCGVAIYGVFFGGSVGMWVFECLCVFCFV